MVLALSVLSEPTRQRILEMLAPGPLSSGDIARRLAASPPAISQHLRTLREARLVRERRVGRERIYQLDPLPLQRVAGWIEGYRAFWVTSLDNLKRRLEDR